MGVRWNTTSRSTSGAIEGMTWTAEAPVPMTATLRPRRSRPWSQRAVCITVPPKLSRPSISGGLGCEKTPVAPTTWRAVSVAPSAVESFQWWPCSSNVAPSTFVLSRMRERSP